MARNEHKKVLQQLSEAYQTVQERYVMRDPDGDGSWPDDEREEERRKNPDYGEPEYQDTDGEYGEDAEDGEGWGRVAKGALLGSLLGKGAVTGGLAGAAYHALKGDTPKKKEKKKKRGSWSGANYEDAEDDAGLWRDQMKHQPDVSPEEVERLKNRKPKPQRYSKKHPKR